MLVRVLKDALRRYEAHGDLLAAAIAFYALLSFAPVLVILVTMLSAFYEPEHMRQRLSERLTELTNADLAGFVVRVMDAAELTTTGTLTALLATGMLLWASTRLFVQVQEALNLMWGVAPPRTESAREALRDLVQRRLLSFGVLLGCGVILMLTLLVQTVFSAVAGVLARLLSSLVDVSQISIAMLSVQQLVVSLFLLSMVFALIYRVLPDARIQFRAALVGAVLTALLVQLGTWLLGLYLTRIAPGWLYGAVGTIAAFMLWTYYLAHVFLIGAAFTRAWAGRKGKPFDHAGTKKAVRTGLRTA